VKQWTPAMAGPLAAEATFALGEAQAGRWAMLDRVLGHTRHNPPPRSHRKDSALKQAVAHVRHAFTNGAI
jgi:hypothetical protein